MYHLLKNPDSYQKVQEEVDNVLVEDIVRAIACDVERRGARCVLRKLVAPEVLVLLVLRDPVLVHYADGKRTGLSLPRGCA